MHGTRSRTFNNMRRPLFLLLLVLLPWATASAQAETDHPFYFTPKGGISAFTGIMGFEAQFRHLAFDIGIPLSGGIRYYVRPNQHSWFAGLYGQGFGYDHDETKDGVAYTHFSTIGGGAGGGYRWFWRQRWSLELGLTVGYFEDQWTSRSAWRTEKGIRLIPVATAGFSFR